MFSTPQAPLTPTDEPPVIVTQQDELVIMEQPVEVDDSFNTGVCRPPSTRGNWSDLVWTCIIPVTEKDNSQGLVCFFFNVYCKKL